MNRVATAVILLVSVGIGVLLFRQWALGQQLRVEVEGERSRSDVRRELAEANQRMAASQPAPEEIERLRGDRVALVRLKTEVETSQARTERLEAAKANTAPPLAATPIAELKNEGRAAPTAAIRTMAWAAARADAETMKKSIIWDASVAAVAERMWTELPEKIRLEYGSLDQLMANYLANYELGGITGLAIAEVREEGIDTAFVHTRIDKGEKQGRIAPLEFRRSADGWQLVLRNPALALLRRLRDQK